MSPPARAGATPNEYDLTVARDVGELKADVRTIKHDVAGLQTSLTLLNDKLNGLTADKAKGLGFFAGAAFIVTTFGALLIALAKIAFFGGNISSGHP